MLARRYLFVPSTLLFLVQQQVSVEASSESAVEHRGHWLAGNSCIGASKVGCIWRLCCMGWL